LEHIIPMSWKGSAPSPPNQHCRVDRAATDGGGEDQGAEEAFMGLYTIHYTLYAIHYTLSTIHYTLCMWSQPNRPNLARDSLGLSGPCSQLTHGLPVTCDSEGRHLGGVITGL